MRVIVDWDLCEGHGQCEFAAPDVFTIDDDGTLEVLETTPKESERRGVEQAVRRCPTRALAIEDEQIEQSPASIAGTEARGVTND